MSRAHKRRAVFCEALRVAQVRSAFVLPDWIATAVASGQLLLAATPGWLYIDIGHAQQCVRIADTDWLVYESGRIHVYTEALFASTFEALA